MITVTLVLDTALEAPMTELRMDAAPMVGDRIALGDGAGGVHSSFVVIARSWTCARNFAELGCIVRRLS